MTDPTPLQIAGRGQRPLDVIAEMAERIRGVIYDYPETPVSTIVGVLQIVAVELIAEATK